MSYKFITGANPMHTESQRREYIICVSPIPAIIEVKKGRYDADFNGYHKGEAFNMYLKFMKEPTKEEADKLSSKMLRNAWRWYKSVLESR
jgi:hypothetical protein